MSFRKFGAGEHVDDWSRKIQSIMEEMSRRIFFEYRASGCWQPRVNLYATRTAYCLCIEIAGLERDSLLVECRDAFHARFSGRRERALLPSVSQPYSIEMMEIDEGPFSREIELPEPIDPAAIELAYDRGYLWIVLPKTNPT